MFFFPLNSIYYIYKKIFNKNIHLKVTLTKKYLIKNIDKGDKRKRNE